MLNAFAMLLAEAGGTASRLIAGLDELPRLAARAPVSEATESSVAHSPRPIAQETRVVGYRVVKVRDNDRNVKAGDLPEPL